MSKSAMEAEILSAADEQWGYKFGVDGLMSSKEACHYLGDVSRQTLHRYWSKGFIRKGNQPGRAKFCRRSILNYAQSIES